MKPFMRNVFLNAENKISDVSCCIFKMKHDTSEVLSSLFKMTFNLKGSVDQEFSCIVKIYKKIIFRQKFVFYEFMATELFMDKEISKTDETLHEECIFKCRK
jgi:hypothetical protein